MGSKDFDPPIQHPLIETHCHLDYLKQASIQELIERASAQSVEKIITIAVTPQNLETVKQIANTYPHVYASQGVHPHDAKRYNQVVENKIRENLKTHSKLIAVGEIGLDYHYNNSPQLEQRNAFESQLHLAAELDYPVIIHTRDAEEDTLAILKNMSSRLKKKGVLHSYTSSWELAEYCLNEGFYLGFNGIISFKKAQEVRDVCQRTPIEQTLLETDAPFLTPVPHRGKENAPHYLPYVAHKLLEIKQLKAEIALPAIYKNSLDLFGL